MIINKRGSTVVMLKAVFLNLFNIIRFYPKLMYMAHHQKKYLPQQKYDYCEKLIHVLIDTCKIKIDVKGLENIPEKDGFYLCSNHQEKFDPLAIWYTFPRKIGVVVNDDATHRPFISELCTLISTQKLVTSDIHSIVKTYDSITQELKAGYNYMIFPEGDYEKDVKMLSHFHQGCFKSPKRAGCPILPVALIDSYRIFDKGLKTSRPIQVHYLDPIFPDEYERLSTSEISQIVKERIQKEIDIYQ